MRKIFILIFAAFMLLISPSYASISVDEMVGQMIIVGFSGNNAEQKGFREIVEELKDGKISGVIFFEDNIKNEAELKKMTSKIRNISLKTRPFISIDMEGGEVQRMNSKNGFRNYPTALKTANLSYKKAYENYSDMAQTLSSAFFNLNFGPVVDLDLNPNSILHRKERAYSSNPNEVSVYADAFINSHANKSIITSLKHFPGHGSVKGDTHLNFVNATETFTQQELQPYKDLMNKNNLQTVMISHIYNKNFDEIYPASLSYATVTGLLREKLGFRGVVITDDLDMGAIKENYTLEETVIQAINAGCDILLFSNREHYNPNLADDINKIVKKAIIDGQISLDRIQESYNRVLKLKSDLIASELK